MPQGARTHWTVAVTIGITLAGLRTANAINPAVPCDDVSSPFTAADFYCDEAQLANCNCSQEVGSCPPGAPQHARNVLWVMADDHGYCLYRFQHEPDPNDGSSDLRLNDLGCRYRNATDGGASDNAFVFGRERHDVVTLGNCVSGTCEMAFKKYGPGGQQPCTPGAPDCVTKSCSTAADCVIYRTPMLDTLATQGAVFPLAHVPGHSCVPSWKGIATGRHLKDIQGSLAGGGLRACECEDGCATAQPQGTCPDKIGKKEADATGCNAANTCSCGQCDNIRTFARLLHEGSPGYTTFMAGKLRDDGQGIHGYSNCESFRKESSERIGLLRDGDCSPACATQIEQDYLADGRIDERPHTDVLNRLSTLRDWIGSLPLDATRQLEHPFLLGWAPINPHDGQHVNPPAVFRRIYCPDGVCGGTSGATYGGRSLDAADTLARVTMADYMLAALIDQLKRHCVCDGGTAKSLYDMTVVTFHSDHGAYMPHGKNHDPTSQNMAGENGYRTTMLVSLPEHRAGAVMPRVFDDEVVQTVDLFRTMVGHFDAAPDPVLQSLKGKDLMPYLTQVTACTSDAQCSSGATCQDDTGGSCGGGSPCWCRRPCGSCPAGEVCTTDGGVSFCRTPIRHLIVTQGEGGANASPFKGWLLRPRPGYVGICGVAGEDLPSGILRFCVVDKDCAGLGAAACQRMEDAGASKPRICMNWSPGSGRPARCGSDLDCTRGLCNVTDPETCPAGICRGPTEGGFVDRTESCVVQADGTACMASGTSCVPGCVPPGVCGVPQMKYGAQSVNGSNEVLDLTKQYVYELHTDPDENEDLFDGGAGVGQCLRCLLRECAQDWQKWDGNGKLGGVAADPTATCLDRDLAPGNPAHPCHTDCS